jgi:hypothetical protein
MIHRFCYCALVMVTLAFSVCKLSQADSRLTPVLHAQADALWTVWPDPVQYSNDLFIKADALDYNGYSILKLQKKVGYQYHTSVPSKPDLIDVFYTGLKKDGRMVAEFDGFYYGIGNSNDFGLFPVLGGKTKQLLITQAAPRSGRHWIVDLASPFRVLFDSYDYHVGREDFTLKDIDGDGVYELFFADPSFDMKFAGMTTAETPLPCAIFKYDKQTRKYLPANLLFQDYVLKGIDDQIKQLKPDTEPRYLSDRLDILLRYIYAGKEKEGWRFFDQEYQLDDKAEVKAKVEIVLKQHPFYKFITGKRAA